MSTKNKRAIGGVVIIGALLIYASMTKSVTLLDPILEIVGVKMTRNMRNKNPGNLRHGPAWDGLAAVQSDSAFSTFVSFPYGYRAMVIALRNYQRVHGINTVRGIVTRWAPASENDTNAYINSVSNTVGVSADAPLNLETRAVLEKLAIAITKHEGGSFPADHGPLLAQGLNLAGVA